MLSPIECVQRYLDALFGAAVDVDAVGELLHDRFELIEHPNALSPTGGRRDRAQALEGVRRGGELMDRQTLEQRRFLASDGTVAVRALWRGVLARAAGQLPAGGTINARLAMFFTVADGRILRQENFDCYEPLPKSTPVVTTIDATVPAGRETELLDGFWEINEDDRPDGLVCSELLRGRDGTWRIRSTWRDMESLMAVRNSGRAPAALDLLDRLGAEHSHAVFAVEQRHDA